MKQNLKDYIIENKIDMDLAFKYLYALHHINIYETNLVYELERCLKQAKVNRFDIKKNINEIKNKLKCIFNKDVWTHFSPELIDDYCVFADAFSDMLDTLFGFSNQNSIIVSAKYKKGDKLSILLNGEQRECVVIRYICSITHEDKFDMDAYYEVEILNNDKPSGIIMKIKDEDIFVVKQ